MIKALFFLVGAALSAIALIFYYSSNVSKIEVHARAHLLSEIISSTSEVDEDVTGIKTTELCSAAGSVARDFDVLQLRDSAFNAGRYDEILDKFLIGSCPEKPKIN